VLKEVPRIEYTFRTQLRTALALTEPPIERVPGAKRLGREADKSPASSAEVNNA